MERALERLMRAIERILALALLAAIALNFANVIGRYVFGRTLTGADEMQTYAMVWIAFLGAGVVAWRGEHLRMDILARRLPSGIQIGLRWLEGALVVLLGGFALWQSVRYVESMLRLGANSPMAQIPMWLPHGGVAAGLALLILAALWRLARRER
jgi:TRAP-type C4-dicarboxylate transport system permease small subunit